MLWNDHSNLTGKHAIFSASKYSWLNYSDEKMFTAFINNKMVAMGTALHAFCAGRIERKHPLPKGKKAVLDLFEEFLYSGKDTAWLIRYISQIRPEVISNITLYVNDAIALDLSPEVVLRYSDNFFGTTDAISFDGHILRIHDLKTGVSPTHMEQLLIYAALFCLEYKVDPIDIQFELRIYQNNDPVVYLPEPTEIIPIINKIIECNKTLNKFMEVESYE